MPGSDASTISNQMPSPPGGDAGRTAWIALGIAAAVLLIGGGALLGFALIRSGSQPDVNASRNEVDARRASSTEEQRESNETDPAIASGDVGETTTDVAAPTLPPATTPPATAPPATAPPATSAPAVAVSATVNRTCGADGTGDCFLALRARPSSDGSELGRIDEGGSLTLACQQRGETVRSSALGYPVDVWARTTAGQWASMAFLDAPGWSLTDITVPC